MAADVLELPAPAPARSHEHPEGRNYYPALLLAVIAISAVLRVYDVSSKSFWMDEGMSVEFARLSWPRFFAVVWNREANMAAYYVLLRYWLLLGRSEGFVRGLSVLFSVGTVPVLYALGKQLFDRRAGLLAAFLLSINAFHIRYAQETRSYAMVVFLATLASWLFVRNLQKPDSARWGAYAAICALAVYTHFYAGLMVVAHLISLAFLPRKDVPWKSIARHLAWFSCLMIPIGAFVAWKGTDPINWIQPIDSAILLHWGFDFSGNYGAPLLALDVLAIGIFVLSMNRARQNGHSPVEIWKYIFPFAWLFIPVALVITASLARSLFVTRYLSPCFPAMILLVAAGILRSRPGLVRWPVFFAISLMSLLGTMSYYQRDFDMSRQDWRSAAAYVLDHAEPGDSIFFYWGEGQPVFEFYRWQRNPLPVWPKSLNPVFSPDEDGSKFQFIQGTDVLAARPAGSRIWLVLISPVGPDGLPDPATAKVREWFAMGRHTVAVQRLFPIGILLFTDDAPASGQSTPIAR